MAKRRSIAKKVTFEVETNKETSEPEVRVADYPKGARIIVVQFDESAPQRIKVLQKPVDVVIEVRDLDNPPGFHHGDISEQMLP